MLCRGLLLAVPVFALCLADAQAQDENPVVTLIKSKVKDVKKPFAITVEFNVKAGKEKDFEAAFRPCLKATRKEPGCVAYHLNRDPDNPQTYIMYEQFRSVAALEAHMKEKHTETLLAAVGPMCEGAPKIKVLLVPE